MPRRLSLSLAHSIFVVALLATSAAHAEPEATFDLPAQPLAESLLAVARATRVNILFDADVVMGIRAPALKGNDTAEEALKSLLAPSGLRYSRVDSHTLRVGRVVGSERAKRHGGTAFQSDDGSGPAASGEAQNTGESETAASGTPIELSEVIVTGSHIHGAANPSPTITISRQDIDRSGYVDVGDVIRTLPQDFSGGNTPQTSVSNTPSQDNGNFSGGSSPNLRGLGPESTLTLLNGRRLGQDGILGAVDISLIPLSAVERIEVVTDSSSAAYGSDAVAGVVNFILRKDYEGAETSGSLATSTQGGGYDREVNQLAGHSWGSGGALVAYEHERQDAVWADQRDFTATAAMPSTLLPQASRDSAFLSTHQDVGNRLSFSADGLYTSRTSDSELTYPPSFRAETLLTGYAVNQYLANLGVTGTLGRDWKANAYASVAAERNLARDYQFTPVTPTGNLFEQVVYRGATRTAEASADGPLWELGRDSVRAAIGGGYREESLDVLLTVPGSSAVRMRRGVRYAFTEFDVPLESLLSPIPMHALDLNLSGRYEGYTDSIGKAVPKMGLLISPTPSLSFRTTWSEAFRAPTLYSLGSARELYLVTLADPVSPTGSSQDLVRLGGNPQLRPETAKTWTVGAEWSPEWMGGGSAQLTYFDIRYRDRVRSLSNYLTALTNPEDEPLVTRDPPDAVQQAYISDAAGAFYNLSGQPYVASSIAALIDARWLNVAEQHLNGTDLLIRYRRALSVGGVEAFANGSYLQFRERITPDSPEVELAGITFNPPRFRGRTGITWTARGFAATGTVNWIDHSVNTYSPGSPTVGSWTTFDAQLTYRAPERGLFSGLSASLSVQNMLDRDPPFAQYLASPAIVGFNYDSNNYSPMGRYITLQVSKEWFPGRERE